jgi:uncharacterized membrane protein YkoI
MKINRFIALAAIALLVIGTMGFLSYRANAQTDSPSAASDCGPETEDDDAAEAEETGPDLDDIQEECGDQAEDGEPDSDEANDADCPGEPDNDAAEAAESGPDTDDIQEGCGSQVEDETDEVDGHEDDDAIPTGEAAITPEEAEAAALTEFPGASVVEVELESEAGVLVYSIELDNGTDLNVDANNGAVTTEVDDD